MHNENPAGPAERAVADDKVGEAIPPQVAQQLFGGGGGSPPKQTQTITVNLPSVAEGRDSDIQVVVDIVQEGLEGNVVATVESHGVTPTDAEYDAIARILSSLV